MILFHFLLFFHNKLLIFHCHLICILIKWIYIVTIIERRIRYIMKKKIKIQNTVYWSIAVTLIFTVIFICICIFNQKQFHSFQESSQQYILCKDSVEQLEEGCNYLVDQARLYAMTSNKYYMDLYFREAHMTKRR